VRIAIVWRYWLVVERRDGPHVLTAGLLALAVGIGVGYHSGWIDGVIAYLFSGLAIVVIWDLYFSLTLPADSGLAAETAVTRFRRTYPKAAIEDVRVRDVQAERIVIAILHQPNPGAVVHPTPRRYFAVSRKESRTVTELDVERWRPLGLK
jgi:hypothetical protein